MAQHTDSKIRIELARSNQTGTMASMSRDLIEHGLKWRWKAPKIQAIMLHPEAVVICAMNQSAMDQSAMNQSAMNQSAMNQSAMNQSAMNQSAMNQSAMDQNAMKKRVMGDSDLLGFAIMEFQKDSAHLNLLAVKPDSRRQGVGKNLVAWLMKSVRVAGIARVALEVRSNNLAALKFYESLGFELGDRIKAYYDGREDAYKMNLQVIDPAFKAQRL